MSDYGLLVGINTYPGLQPSQQLKLAVTDATAVRDWLEQNGADPAQLKLLTSTDGPGRPTHDDVDEALLELFALAENDSDPDKRFFLYFSGHGLGPKRFSHDLCLAGWSDRRSQCALQHESYRDLLAECGLFAQIFFFLDCCRDRGVAKTGLPNSIGSGWPGEGASDSRYFVAHAAEYQKPAYETDLEKRSVFTEALLSGLNGAAADDQGRVRLNGLVQWLETETPRLALKKRYHQKPTFGNTFGSQNPVICTVAPPELPATFVFPPGDTQRWTLEDKRLTEIHAAPGDSPWFLQLPLGLYNLVPDHGDGQLIRVRPGEQNRFEIQP